MIRNEIFLRKFGQLSDDQWKDVLLESCYRRVVQSVEFPPLPDKNLQSRFVGSSGIEAFKEAFLFYREVKKYARSLGIPMDRSTKVLDFGVGWGRFYRFFLRDLVTDHFLGVDVDQDCISLCQAAMPYGRFEKCDINPPLGAASGSSFDLIYAYSVFSHLSEETSGLWMKEFVRILKPGGMLILTTLKRAHIKVWQELKETGWEGWRLALGQAGFSVPRAESDFDSGKFLYCGIGGGGVRSADFYGEAIIGPDYVRKTWTPELKLIDYVAEDSRGPQALIVLRKPACE
jgi:2-polyprenyl-3-methyl-5-hydroxy-6-metoxy-1,4-benzoquinol methylase